jgi:hypothetical protein
MGAHALATNEEATLHLGSLPNWGLKAKLGADAYCSPHRTATVEPISLIKQ